MPERAMKEELAAGDLVLCMNRRLARSVVAAGSPPQIIHSMLSRNASGDIGSP